MTGGLPSLQLQFLGPFHVTVNHSALPPLRTQKGRWLLALLALRAGKPVERDWLSGVLWPDSDAASALYNLRRSLSDLRAALGPAADRLDSPSAHTLLLDLTDASFDVAEFDAVCASPPAMPTLERALSLYRGPLLEGCQENWVFSERTDREEKYLRVLQRRASLAREEGDTRTAITCLRRLLQQAPLEEEALRALLHILSEAGDVLAAQETFRSHRLLLHDRFQGDLSTETRALYATLFSERPSGAASKPPAVSAPSVPASRVTDGPPSPAVSGGYTAGGALPANSPYYVERPTDPTFHTALHRRDSIVLVKGPREIGKTSLLARGLANVRKQGGHIVISDLQKLSRQELVSSGSLLQALAEQIAFQLELPAMPTADFGWRPDIGANENFERFMRRHILKPLSGHLVWALDEADRLFGYDFGTDVFSLFRAWHNERALDPEGPWHRLTLVLAYATEVHLFIADINQSPFNVGTRLELKDFTDPEVEDLNRRWGSPLKDGAERERFQRLVGGHPLLVHSGLRALAEQSVHLSDLEAAARSLETSVFSGHLRRLRGALETDTGLGDSIRVLLRQSPEHLSVDAFYRLRTAGVLQGDAPRNARFRCGLYEQYLGTFL